MIRKENLPPLDSQKLIIDLCVPRNVDPQLGNEPNIALYNIDAINRTLRSRKKALGQDLARADDFIQQATCRQTSLFAARESKRLQFAH